jgi:hypothetical protein
MSETLFALPTDITGLIFDYVTTSDVVICRQVCTEFGRNLPVVLDCPYTSSIQHYGTLEHFTMLYELGYRSSVHDLCKLAVQYDRVVIYQQLIRQPDFNIQADEVTALIARYGSMEILKCTKVELMPLTLTAAYYGQIKIMEWAKSQVNQPGRTLLPKHFKNAVKGNSLDMVKWLVANKCGGIHFIYNYALKHGRLEIMKYANEIASNYDNNDCYTATRCGHLDVLIWLRSTGAYWGEDICTIAQEQYAVSTDSRYADILTWIHANGSPCPPTCTYCT